MRTLVVVLPVIGAVAICWAFNFRETMGRWPRNAREWFGSIL